MDNKKEQFILDAITSGEWVVHQFQEGSTNIAGQFAGFTFKFNRDGTVTAHKEVDINETGTWTGDITNYSITSNFPNSSDPIKKLNSTWKIEDSTSDSVKAKSTGTPTINTLILHKVP